MSRSLRNRSRNIKRDRYRTGSYLYDFRSRTYNVGRLPIKGPDRITPITAGAGAVFINDAANTDGWILDHANDDLWIGDTTTGTRVAQGISGCKIQTIEFNSGVLLKITGPATATKYYCFSSPTSITGELDVSALTNLTELLCYANNITILDISTLTSLTYLHCALNSLSTLNVSALINLENLRCYDNSISVLGVTNLTSLQYLRCENTSVSVLDFDNLTTLLYLYCNNTLVTTYVDNAFNLLDSLLRVYWYDCALSTTVVDNIVDDMHADRVAKAAMTNLKLAGTNSAVTGTYQEPIDHDNPANAAEAAWVLVNDEGWTVEINTV